MGSRVNGAPPKGHCVGSQVQVDARRENTSGRILTATSQFTLHAAKCSHWDESSNSWCGLKRLNVSTKRPRLDTTDKTNIMLEPRINNLASKTESGLDGVPILSNSDRVNACRELDELLECNRNAPRRPVRYRNPLSLLCLLQFVADDLSAGRGMQKGTCRTKNLSTGPGCGNGSPGMQLSGDCAEARVPLSTVIDALSLRDAEIRTENLSARGTFNVDDRMLNIAKSSVRKTSVFGRRHPIITLLYGHGTRGSMKHGSPVEKGKAGIEKRVYLSTCFAGRCTPSTGDKRPSLRQCRQEKCLRPGLQILPLAQVIRYDRAAS